MEKSIFNVQSCTVTTATESSMQRCRRLSMRYSIVACGHHATPVPKNPQSTAASESVDKFGVSLVAAVTHFTLKSPCESFCLQVTLECNDHQMTFHSANTCGVVFCITQRQRIILWAADRQVSCSVVMHNESHRIFKCNLIVDIYSGLLHVQQCKSTVCNKLTPSRVLQTPVDAVRDLVVFLDSQLAMKSHVAKVPPSACFICGDFGKFGDELRVRK
jgi:hypothetical protein